MFHSFSPKHHGFLQVEPKKKPKQQFTTRAEIEVTEWRDDCNPTIKLKPNNSWLQTPGTWKEVLHVIVHEVDNALAIGYNPDNTLIINNGRVERAFIGQYTIGTSEEGELTIVDNEGEPLNIDEYVTNMFYHHKEPGIIIPGLFDTYSKFFEGGSSFKTVVGDYKTTTLSTTLRRRQIVAIKDGDLFMSEDFPGEDNQEVRIFRKLPSLRDEVGALNFVSREALYKHDAVRLRLYWDDVKDFALETGRAIDSELLLEMAAVNDITTGISNMTHQESTEKCKTMLDTVKGNTASSFKEIVAYDCKHMKLLPESEMSRNVQKIAKKLQELTVFDDRKKQIKNTKKEKREKSNQIKTESDVLNSDSFEEYENAHLVDHQFSVFVQQHSNLNVDTDPDNYLRLPLTLHRKLDKTSNEFKKDSKYLTFDVDGNLRTNLKEDKILTLGFGTTIIQLKPETLNERTRYWIQLHNIFNSYLFQEDNAMKTKNTNPPKKRSTLTQKQYKTLGYLIKSNPLAVKVNLPRDLKNAKKIIASLRHMFIPLVGDEYGPLLTDTVLQQKIRDGQITDSNIKTAFTNHYKPSIEELPA